MKDGEIEVGGYTTGPDLPVFVTQLDVGALTPIVQDQQNPNGDNLFFGRDYVSPPVWKLAFCVGEGTGPGEALAALARLQRAWRTAVDMRVPGAVTTLSYGAAGRTRRVYGRPRNFTPSVTENIEDGNVVATAEFALADTYHYANELSSLTVDLIPGNAGGLISPLLSPMTTVAGGKRQGLIVVGGDAPTPVTVDFKGPVRNPVASSTGWEIGLRASLAYDQTVTVNVREGTVLRNDGASLGGSLTRNTYLPEARLLPGNREIIFEGIDPTGTASCKVSWRSAFESF